jgi:hypothetical protein
MIQALPPNRQLPATVQSLIMIQALPRSTQATTWSPSMIQALPRRTQATTWSPSMIQVLPCRMSATAVTARSAARILPAKLRTTRLSWLPVSSRAAAGNSGCSCIK